MKKVNVIINDQKISVPASYTVLEAAKEINVEIPTLCHLNLHDLKALTSFEGILIPRLFPHFFTVVSI